MRYLAGLLRVRYVFYYPESKDIVLGRPGGRLGARSGRPDRRHRQRAARRAVARRGRRFAGVSRLAARTRMIGCSIDPTPEGLAAMQQFMRTFNSAGHPR